jgi:hypothetical protein
MEKSVYTFEKTTIKFKPTILDTKKRRKFEFKEAMNAVMSDVLSQNGLNKHLKNIWLGKDEAKKAALIKAMSLKGINVDKLESKCFNTKLQIEALSDWHKQFVVVSHKFEDQKLIKLAVDGEGNYIKKDTVSLSMVFLAIKNMTK